MSTMARSPPGSFIFTRVADRERTLAEETGGISIQTFGSDEAQRAGLNQGD